MEPQLNIKCVNTTTDSDGSMYGKFVIEPLQRGYGITLGNSLRRILLSSLPGSAITSARIEGVSHEYTTIPGIKEDVLNILLNLKGVVLKNQSDEVQYLRIDTDSVGPVRAGDIQVPGDVKIINPDHLICTVSDKGGFHADLTVENGFGYIQATSHENAPVDMLMLDAVFMPIRRVAYNVEDTRVGQQVDFDKLTLEIWSNGSVEVTEALSRAANDLIEHLLPIASLTGAPTLVTHAPSEESEPKKNTPNITVEDLELSVRAFNCLKRANIHSIEELLEKSEHDLLNIKNFGKKSADEVIERLHAFDLHLKPNPEDSELLVE
ncbi:MAG: DNA-directed RNA polymerase subunit alpha [Cyanobacteria bacterium HKST-UBA06]|nr:DNA-directed RNA polymerase subunit alpha [Cyanobacteria bacterium HKST-UBA05]MCA9798103.1 DNA-directed RNA polymerase subunit alpha [Cyanobacteria bacterium HKST-UBA04]MCA9807413.1 DNA-directed RNA polymerase subunit alpha [Cyanobacteria bacterium HKST-UBA06]MCA9841793.1 DNA-directed RNA polymerase subunit alpha [Cyanobacteria bacterium HKST-UBA03]